MDANMYMVNQQYYAQQMIPVNNMMVNQTAALHNNHMNQAAYYNQSAHINQMVSAVPVNGVNGVKTPNKMVKGDSKKPKGRMSAYTFFVQTCREEHRKKHPNENVNFTEFSKKCAERWKQMTDKEKKRFSEMAERDKARYDKEMSTYTPPAGEGGRNKRKKKDPNAPKRPLSAFFLFCHDERPAVKAVHPNYSVGEVAKDLGEKWQKVSAEVKAKYEAKAAADKTRYEKDMANYRNKKGN